MSTLRVCVCVCVKREFARLVSRGTAIVDGRRCLRAGSGHARCLALPATRSSLPHRACPAVTRKSPRGSQRSNARLSGGEKPSLASRTRLSRVRRVNLASSAQKTTTRTTVRLSTLISGTGRTLSGGERRRIPDETPRGLHAPGTEPGRHPRSAIRRCQRPLTTFSTWGKAAMRTMRLARAKAPTTSSTWMVSRPRSEGLSQSSTRNACSVPRASPCSVST